MKKLITAIIFVGLFQIMVSFITSNQIVSISVDYHQNQLLLKEYLAKNQLLTNTYLSLSSINNLKSKIDDGQYFPISKTIDLTK